MKKIAFVDVNKITEDKVSSIMNEVTNERVYNTYENEYFTGYPDIKQNYDKSTPQALRGSKIFISLDRMKEYLTNKLIASLRKNNNRKLPIPKASLKNIQNDMKKLSATNISHVHKYIDQTTKRVKFWNAISCKNGDKNRTEIGYEIIHGDEITKDWLYKTAVTHNKCLTWYLKVVDKDTIDDTFKLPVAAVANTYIAEQ